MLDRRQALIFVSLVLAAGASTSGGQNARTASTNSCRVFPTAMTTVQTSSANRSFQGTTITACSFSAPSLTFTCTTRYSDTNGFSSSTTSATTYATLADIIDEVAVIPPLKRIASMTAKSAGQPGGTTTFVYDAQKRLTRESNAGTTTTYSAWDAAGRPKIARSAARGGTATDLSISYNDAARTQTTSNTQAGVTTSCVQTFDVNGNATSSICTSSLTRDTTNGTTRITSTDRVCR